MFKNNININMNNSAREQAVLKGNGDSGDEHQSSQYQCFISWILLTLPLSLYRVSPKKNVPQSHRKVPLVQKKPSKLDVQQIKRNNFWRLFMRRSNVFWDTLYICLYSVYFALINIFLNFPNSQKEKKSPCIILCTENKKQKKNMFLSAYILNST